MAAAARPAIVNACVFVASVGAMREHLQLAWPSAWHVLLAQLLVPLALTWTWALMKSSMAALHAAKLPLLSTNCPSQKSAPSGWSHWPSQPPVKLDWQSANPFD